MAARTVAAVRRPGVRPVRQDGTDKPEHVAVGVEQVSEAADAGHVRQRACFDGAQIDALAEELVDAAVDPDGDVAAVHGRPCGCRKLVHPSLTSVFAAVRLG
jgi:hypothetical protein